MEQEITFGVRLLNGFLSLMVILLVGILLAVIGCLILWALGLF